MFIDSKYKKWYMNIIRNAKNRENSGIIEIHHIIPKSMGGDNTDENLVKLTPREHFICHWLLTKMTYGKNKMKMTFSLHTFFHFNKYRKLNFKSRQYEYHKISYVVACKSRIPTVKQDIFKFRNLKTTEEFLGTRQDFRAYSGLTNQEINWLVKYCINPDDPKKLIKNWGIWIEKLNIFSYEKYRPSNTINLLPNITCENCGKIVSNGNYNRWHGNKCKLVDMRGHYERTRQVARINGNR